MGARLSQWIVSLKGREVEPGVADRTNLRAIGVYL